MPIRRSAASIRSIPSSSSSVVTISGGLKRTDEDAAAQHDQSPFVARFEKGSAHCGVGQVESTHEAPSPNVADTGVRGSKLLQAHEQMRSQPVYLVHDILLLHDLQDPVEADHVRKIAAPGRVDAARQAEYMIFYLVHLRTGQHAADLCLLPERNQVGAYAERLVRPEPSGKADAGLYFVEDEQRVVLVGQFLQPDKKFRAKVVIPPFPLNGFDDHRGDIVSVCLKMLLGPVERGGFGPLDLFEMRIQRMNDLGVRYARPIEEGKMTNFVRIRRVRERKRVSRTPVERLL